MFNKKDPFRPSIPGLLQDLYDAWAKASESRKTDEHSQWDRNEALAIWAEACRHAAQTNKLLAPTLEQVFMAQSRALGHADYPLTWVCGVRDIMVKTGG